MRQDIQTLRPSDVIKKMQTNKSEPEDFLPYMHYVTIKNQNSETAHEKTNKTTRNMAFEGLACMAGIQRGRKEER